MFRAKVLIVRKPKLYYTISGIITPIGGRPVHRLREGHVSNVGDTIVTFSLSTIHASLYYKATNPTFLPQKIRAHGLIQILASVTAGQYIVYVTVHQYFYPYFFG